MRVNPLAELSVLLVDIDDMTELHERWMGEPGPTDVLAFPMDEVSVDHGPDERGRRRRAGAARRRRALPGGGRQAGGRAPGTRRPTSCTCSPCTGSCTCSATTTPSRTRSGRCSRCRPSCWPAGARGARRARRARGPVREPAAGRRRESARLSSSTGCAAWSPPCCWWRGGVRRCRGGAVAAVSPARAEELAREGRRARAARLRSSPADVVRHLNLLLLLRLLCELTATVPGRARRRGQLSAPAGRGRWSPPGR